MAQTLNAAPVAIVGGGYAGFAAGVELAAAGVPVHLYEASRTLGGRARRADVKTADLDNGQHILVGAYRETLRLMALVGADPEHCLRRLDLHLEYPGALRIHAPDWPAPLHLAAALLGAKGLNWREKWAAIRFMQTLKAQGFRLAEDTTVTTLLDQARQPAKLRRYLWEPLCLATLNTPASAASAQVFAHVLRDTLGADKAASQLLLPRTDLSTLFPEPAARHIEARGGRVLRGHRVARLSRNGTGWRLDDIAVDYRQIILATAPHHLSVLLAPLQQQTPALDELLKGLGGLRYEPIATVYSQYPAHVALPQPMIGGFAEGDGLCQWLFDRGQLLGPPGLLAAVISASGPQDALTPAQLAAAIHAETARLLPGLPPPLWQQAITEKRATFACVPKLPRLGAVTPLPGLFLAGDHVASDYPATLEGAVRSGIAAARLILGQ
ncbi:hydroxysqualene dehydroxylase HpnE [Denitratisoma sp. agr-D3]